MFTLSVVEGAAVGFTVGAFTPAVGRKIKALFVKEADAVKADVKADESKVVADVTKKL
jgi:hypothetical protein